MKPKEKTLDWRERFVAEKIVELTGYGQALHINDILPDIKEATNQAYQEGIDRCVEEASQIVEEMMEDHEYWKPIVRRIKSLKGLTKE